MKHISVVLLIMCFLSTTMLGGSPTPLPDEPSFNRLALKAAFSPIQVYASDSNYSRVNVGHLLTEVGLFRKHLRERGLKYNKRWDCEDFTGAFISQVKESFSKSEDYPEDTDGIAIGEIWYYVDGNIMQGHSAGIAITERGVIIIDTINCTFYDLTTEEWNSVIQIRF